MGTGIIETLIAIGTVALTALGFYIKSKITEYMGTQKKDIDNSIRDNNTELKDYLSEEIDSKLAPIVQKQQDHNKDIDRLKDKQEKHSIDIKALETNVTTVLRSQERLMEKIDNLIEKLITK